MDKNFEPVTPKEEDFGDNNHLDFFENKENPLRKSMSMNDVAALRDNFVNLSKKIAKKRPAEAPEGLVKNKYVSMAEAIYYYDSRSANLPLKPASHASRPRLTVPQSPKLLCKLRARPLHILSREEKEQIELDEIRKIKIKARPIPKVVKEGTNKLPEVQRKPSTVPQPFKLTEPPKKPPPASPEPEVAFKARPAPKHILEKAYVLSKPPVVVTKAITPKFHYKRANSENELNEKAMSAPNTATKHESEEKKNKPIQRIGPLKPIPFSFEKRDELMKKCKEERIKQTIEDEKKQASQFKAQPLPGVIKKHMRNAVPKGASSTSSSENKENHNKFEARPPLVLYKEPFKPVLPAPQLVQSKPFNLASEKRAEEREKFEQMLRQKEEEQEEIRQIKEKELFELEEKAKIELRAKMVHKAKPVPPVVSNPFPERPPPALTVPETPKLLRRLLQK